MTDEFYMSLALKEAKKALAHNDIPVGAVIVKDEIVLAKAHNECELKKDSTAHAEILAIQSACHTLGLKNLSGCEIFVTLEPCAMCAGAILNARIKTIIYGANEPLFGACGSTLNLVQFPSFPHNSRIRANVLEDESKLLLQEFFQKLRKMKDE